MELASNIKQDTNNSNGYYEVYRHFQGEFFALGWGEGGVGVTWEDLFMEDFIMREEMKGVQDFLALLKKKQ